LEASGIVHLEGRNLRRIPAFIRGEYVKEVWVQTNRISAFPSQANSWVGAEVIYANGNQIKRIPGDAAGNWRSLQEANFSGNPSLTAIPEEAKQWVALKQLYLDELPLLVTLPPNAVGSWKLLKVLHINNTALSCLPDSIGELINLTMVALNDNKLTCLPESIRSWTNAEKIFLNNNALSSLPDGMGALAQLTRLYVNSNRLEYLPPSLGALSVLEELYASNNHLAQIPLEIGQCSQLSKLYVNDNQLTAFPAELGNCTALEILNGSNNQLQSLPQGFFRRLNKLKFLHLVDNQITRFPFDDFTGGGKDGEGTPGGTVGKKKCKLQELRAFDVEGNPFLEDEAQAAEAAGVRSRLKQPWAFTRGPDGTGQAPADQRQNTGTSGTGNGGSGNAKSAVKSAPPADAEALSVTVGGDCQSI
jgi:leucine-rich repeat protein SHOC2